MDELLLSRLLFVPSGDVVIFRARDIQEWSLHRTGRDGASERVRSESIEIYVLLPAK